MTAPALLARALAEGVTLALEPPDRIRVTGPAEARARWLPAIRAAKPELVALLTEPLRLWRIREADGTCWTSTFAPLQTLVQVQAWYSGAEVEPATDPDPGGPIPPAVADLVNGWLNRIGETCPQTRAEALELARTRPSVQAIYRSMAGPAAPPDLGQAAERLTVRCSSCVHFQRSDPDPSGFGSCLVNAATSRREGTLWPNAEHNCHDHHEVSA